MVSPQNMPKKALPLTVKLPDTLAQRLQFVREYRNYTLAQLSEESGIEGQLLDEIEGGIQLFMPTPIRQKLARVLRVSPKVFSETEKTIVLPEEEEEYDMLATPLEYRHVPSQCPHCEVDLVRKQFKRYDIQGGVIQAITAHCPQCLYRIQAES